LNQERDRGATLAATALPCSGRCAKNRTDPVADISRSAECSSGQSRGHFEVQSVFFVERAAANEGSESRQNGIEVFSAKTVGSHVNVGSKFFYFEVFAGFQAGQRRDGGHFGAEVEAFELRGVKTNRAIGNQFVGRTLDIKVGAEGAGV